MSSVRCLEFVAAAEAFNNRREPAPVDPFVTRWHQTYTYPRQRDYQNMLVNYSLVDQVLPLAMLNPDVCRNVPWHARHLQRAVDQDRAVTDAVRRNRERFENAVKKDMRECGVSLPVGDIERFANWLRERFALPRLAALR
jgi:hypothetical protein